MFVGHYAVSFALKSQIQKVPLWALFIAVQFLDLVFFPLTLFGIEKFNLFENYTASTHFQLLHMPYSHSLIAVVLWGILAYLLVYCAFYRYKKQKTKIAAVIVVALISHWWLDLIVHTPDLPLALDSETKYGLGLWQYAYATYILEAVLLILGLYYYMKTTQAVSSTFNLTAKYSMPLFVLFLLLINAVNIFAPLSADETTTSVAISALFAYGIFAAIAGWLERKRTAISAD